MSKASANRSEVIKIQLNGGSIYCQPTKKWVTDHG